jgi:hypothetical protein
MSRSTILAVANEKRHRDIDISRIYYECIPILGGLTIDKIPNFDEIYDQYIAAFVELQTSLTVDEIDMELLRLKNDYGPEIFDVERGFDNDPSEHKRVYVMEYLMYNQLFFAKDKVVYNAPLVGVW